MNLILVALAVLGLLAIVTIVFAVELHKCGKAIDEERSL
jgi:hypothetical protein